MPEGAVVLLQPQPDDADYLNLNRPVFARRRLKVVLWCSEETTNALATRAVDFFDWISHRHECPPGVALHCVLGLRAAAQANAPIVVWTGRMLEACFQSAFPNEHFVSISAKRPYQEIVAAIIAAREKWIVWDDIKGGIYRWYIIEQAMAEAGRASKTIMRTQYSRLDYPTIDAETMDLHHACRELEMAPMHCRGRLAALSDLEVAAVLLLKQLLMGAADVEEIERTLKTAEDPGVALLKLFAKNANPPATPIELRAHPESAAWNPGRIGQLRQNPNKLVEDVVSTALSASMLADTAEAVSLSERAVEVTAQICGPASDDHLLALIHLAKVIAASGRFQQALEILESVLMAVRDGTTSRRVTFMLYDIWRDVLRHSGRYDMAEEKAHFALDAASGLGNESLVRDAENHVREIRALRERSSG